MESIWQQDFEMPRRPRLEDAIISTEVAIVGGGMAGILCAALLKERGIESVVLEADRIGGGQTKNTTAKITSQHGLCYNRLIRDFGLANAKKYAYANEKAISEYRRLIEKHSIDCDFEYKPAYIYSTCDTASLLREARAAKRLGISAEFTTKTALPFDIAGAVRFDSGAQFHPLKFLAAISKDLNIYEDTRVIKIKGHTLYTERGRVRAKNIIIATHYPFVNFPGLYFARVHQERSYVLALKNAATLDGNYLGIDKDGLSFRNYGDILLLGGGSHRTGENSRGGKYRELWKKAKELYPNCSEITRWSAQDCITSDEVPFIGRYSSLDPSIFVATGFKKWGMTTSMVAAMILSAKISGRTPKYASVFSPGRFFLRASAKNLLTDLGNSAKGLTKSALYLPPHVLRKLPNSHGGIVKYHGNKVGVYKDEDGNAFVVSVRCPHLGCQLEWNPDERTWDCPCHGSRFDYRGRLIDNPAQTNLERFK